MYTLVATDANGQFVGSVEVDRDPQTIGRDPSCGLVLMSVGVSRRHASVYLHGGGVVVNDEGSANGVKVDGRLIQGPTLIDMHNVVQISTFLLRLQEGTPAGVPAPRPPAAAADDAQVSTRRQAARRSPVEEEEEEEFDTRLEERSGAGEALARRVLTLTGRGGPYDGTVFRLEKVLLTVGRDDENDITLEDPSVSRRHAQLRLSAVGNRMTVLDLRSSNGTFVDGQKIKRSEIEPGAVVRFGDMAFKLEVSSPGEQKRRGWTRKRLWIASGAVLALLLTVVVIGIAMRPKPVVKRKLTPEELLRRRQAEVQSLVDKARQKANGRRWSAAIQALDQALKRDPLNATAKKLRAKALDELQHKATFERGQKYFALGNRENLLKAREAFEKVPSRSIYARETRYKIKQINERIATSFRIDGVSRCKARYYRRCYQLLCRFFELIPKDLSVPGEGKLRRRMKWIERRYRRRRSFKKCEAYRYEHVPAHETVENPQELLAKRYKNRHIRAVVSDYVRGRIDNALKRLARLRRKRSMRPHAATLDEIKRQLLIIRGKYQEGFTFLRARDVEKADRHWQELLAADKALVPKKVTTFYRREVTKLLAALYAELGEEKNKVGDHRAAFGLWSKGKKVDPSNAEVLNGLLELEKVAERLVREGQAAATSGRIADARNKLTTARDICEKGRPTRAQAEKALKAIGSR